MSDPRITFDIGSAMDLPYATASFDRSLSLLVFTFIPEPEKAASEIRRVTRTGGTIAACNWDPDGVDMNSVLWLPLTLPEMPPFRPAASLQTCRIADAPGWYHARGYTRSAFQGARPASDTFTLFVHPG
jgi:ubiquinone/menaquinone biosynthesis C-methylase UbiE